MLKYVKPEITVKEYRVTEDIATIKEYYYQSGGAEAEVNVSLFEASLMTS